MRTMKNHRHSARITAALLLALGCGGGSDAPKTGVAALDQADGSGHPAPNIVTMGGGLAPIGGPWKNEFSRTKRAIELRIRNVSSRM